jgi:hypothetical protein
MSDDASFHFLAYTQRCGIVGIIAPFGLITAIHRWPLPSPIGERAGRLIPLVFLPQLKVGLSASLGYVRRSGINTDMTIPEA